MNKICIIFLFLTFCFGCVKQKNHFGTNSIELHQRINVNDIDLDEFYSPSNLSKLALCNSFDMDYSYGELYQGFDLMKSDNLEDLKVFLQNQNDCMIELRLKIVNNILVVSKSYNDRTGFAKKLTVQEIDKIRNFYDKIKFTDFCSEECEDCTLDVLIINNELLYYGMSLSMYSVDNSVFSFLDLFYKSNHENEKEILVIKDIESCILPMLNYVIHDIAGL